MQPRTQQPHARLEFICSIYIIPLACYQVLHTLQDERAPAILAASYQKLVAYAEQISSAELQRAYLENVSANRELVAAWQAAQGEA